MKMSIGSKFSIFLTLDNISFAFSKPFLFQISACVPYIFSDTFHGETIIFLFVPCKEATSQPDGNSDTSSVSDFFQ